ncbi:unnamed protein product [Heligmosomoides polygyrus]|uniref:Secreted protein n=1 Tax=Heligmosomoides polygyrus TaxID=6339 RepID=A0A183FZ16_HELPZ|nr:unnamed protein product [Heligmosomoides polygyrus]
MHIKRYLAILALALSLSPPRWSALFLTAYRGTGFHPPPLSVSCRHLLGTNLLLPHSIAATLEELAFIRCATKDGCPVHVFDNTPFGGLRRAEMNEDAPATGLTVPPGINVFMRQVNLDNPVRHANHL